MSDARTDFFDSGSKSAPAKAAKSRDDFFAGDFDIDEDTPPPAKASKKESSSAAAAAGFGRGGKAPTQETLAAMRDSTLSRVAQGAVDDPIGTIKAIPAGFNRGVTALAGMPVDTMANVADLAGMGYGAARSLIQQGDMGASEEFYTPLDRSDVIGGGDWFSQKLDQAATALGGGPVTQLENPENPAARVMFNAAAGVPGGVIGGGPLAPMLSSGAAGGAAGALVAEGGGDPAMQALASLGAGMAASRLTDSPDAPTVRPARKATADDASADAQAKLNAAASKQSMGASSAAVDLQKLSPELRVAVEKAVQQTGGAVNPEVLARQIQADSLPVKVRLSEGQALGDERLISLELNARGKHEAYSKGFKEQNTALVENLRALRDENGPEVFSTNATEHADTLIGRYQAIDDARRTEISAKYKALEEANGGQFPVNGRTFVSAADAALAKKMKTRYLPAEVRGDLDDFRDNAGQMTFEQFENLRTNLATAGRKADRAGDGNAEAAINLVREALEQLPMEGAAANLKALADDARQAAKARFDSLLADPAYKAAVNESVTPDVFVQKYVVNGARDNVERLAAAMADDPSALQTLRVATLDHLRKSAGIDPGYNGNFTQAGFNKALQALEPKLFSLLDPKTAETARTLGDVARYTQFQPKGSFANNSNTFVSAAAEKAADALEGIVDFKAGGIPIASTIRKQLNENKVKKQAEETFAPGAGLTKLSDLSKVKKP